MSPRNKNKVTALDANIDYSVKHPLQNTWTLWFDNPKSKTNTESWADNLKEIISLDTVEDFWSTFNNVAKITHLSPNSNYHFFKRGIRPEWEDESNAKGGKFAMSIPRNKSGDVINEYWMNLLLAIIGEQLATEEEICGAVISVRKSFFKLALWIKSSDDEDKIDKIRQSLRETLQLPDTIIIEFITHDTSVKIAVALTNTTLEDKAPVEEEAETTEETKDTK